MNLTHCVVHEIVKEAGSNSAQAYFSERVMTITDEVSHLVEQLLRSFGGSRQVNARFTDAPGKLFPQKFADYVAGGNGDAEFLEYSRQVVGHLETVIQPKSGAKGGYLLLCAYDDAEGHRHGVFLLRNTVGRIFRRTAEGFSIEEVLHLDVNNLAMGCRIDVGRFLAGAGSCLELTHRTEQEVSAYFSDWIGVEETLSSKAMTSSLQELLGSIEVLDEQTGEVQSTARIYEKAYEHVKASPSKVIDIHELSQELYGSPARIEEQARERGIELEPEFRYNPAALKDLVMMRAVVDGIDLRFPRTALEDGVMYTEGEGSDARLVIASPELVARILGY